MKVLLLDDEEWNISKLDETLKLANFEVDYASNLENALTYLRRGTNYAAIVTDFHMERLNGKQFISMIKGLYEHEVGIDELSLGLVDAFDADIAQVVKDEFENFKEYLSLVKRFEDVPFVLFSSATYGDGCDNMNVFVELKNNQDHNDYRAEKNIVNYLMERIMPHGL
tara:strand:+ start:31178 stop:31681 length:504 start_codon:yes stop_codon:yes gene_type:complete